MGKIELPANFGSVPANRDPSSLAGTGGKERVAIVIDVSGSMGAGFVGNERHGSRLDAAKRSIETIVAHSSRAVSELGLISFSDDAELHHPISGSFSSVIAHAHRMRTRGGTGYIPALGAALAENPNRVIFLSDGQPTDASEEQILHYCETFKNLGIKIDCVGIGSAGDLLKRMAEMTGGVFAFADTVSELVNTFQQLESRARLRLAHQP